MPSIQSLISRLVFVALLAGVLLAPAAPLQAQIFCEGEACDLLPLSTTELSTMLYAFQYQYANELFQDMADAATLANIAQAPIGSVHLHRFAVGGYMGAGVVKPREIPVYIPGVGTLDPIPSAGVGINPRVFAGVNLGWLMGQGYEPFEGNPTPGMFSPARFDIYLNGVEFIGRQNRGGFDGFEPEITTDSSGQNPEVKFVPQQKNTQASVEAFSRGGEIRYHLMEGLGSVWARWYGVNLGLGHSVSRQEVEMVQAEDKIGFKVEEQGATVDLVWEGQNFLNWTTRMNTTTFDVKTGVQFLYLFNLTVAVGAASSSGKSKFIMTRTGPVYASSDLEAVYGLNIPDAFLTLILFGEGKARPTTPYARVGLGFNFGPLKLTAEALYTDRARNVGANLGLFFQF